MVVAAGLGAAATVYSANKSAGATKDASNKSTALQREQYQQGLKEVAPFKEAGLSALPGLQSVANTESSPFAFRDQNKFLSDYFSSPEYSILNKQAQDQILSSASATGGIRNGNTIASLMSVAPTLGIDALNRVNQMDTSAYSINQGALTDRFNRLNSLASMGANVASGNQVAGANFASNAGNNAMAAGQANALKYQQQGQAFSGLVSDLGTINYGVKKGLI